MRMKKLSFSTECLSLWEPTSQMAGPLLNPRRHSVSSLTLLHLPSQAFPHTMSAKVVSLDELRQHTDKESIWVLLNGKGLSYRYLPLVPKVSDCLAVYDVTKFIDEVHYLLAFLFCNNGTYTSCSTLGEMKLFFLRLVSNYFPIEGAVIHSVLKARTPLRHLRMSDTLTRHALSYRDYSSESLKRVLM